MSIQKQTSISNSGNVFTSAAKVAISHKITSSVSAVAIVVAGSMIVSAQTTGTKQQLQQNTDLSFSSQTTPESTDKSDITPSTTTSIPTNELPQQEASGLAHVDITTGDDVDATVRINGRQVPTPNTSGSTHQTVPTANETGNMTLDISAHNQSSDNSKNKTTNTMRISTSSSSKSTVKSTETTRITGGQ